MTKTTTKTRKNTSIHVKQQDSIEPTESMLASNLDLQKFQLEKEKLDFEKKKLQVEQDKLLVSSMLEDFKARWQELLNFENENSRWQTLYVTALMLVISWILSNSGGQNSKFSSIANIFEGENSYLLLTLALINAVYTLAIAYKGYQIQEIAQYLFDYVGTLISNKIDGEFNSWERWRRSKTGSPVLIRTIYYFIIGILPTAVSTTILCLYYYYRYDESFMLSPINVFSYFVCLFVLLSLLTALSTTKMNNKWEDILSK